MNNYSKIKTFSIIIYITKKKEKKNNLTEIIFKKIFILNTVGLCTTFIFWFKFSNDYVPWCNKFVRDSILPNKESQRFYLIIWLLIVSNIFNILFKKSIF